jgi:hypothetical protein
MQHHVMFVDYSVTRNRAMLYNMNFESTQFTSLHFGSPNAISAYFFLLVVYPTGRRQEVKVL